MDFFSILTLLGGLAMFLYGMQVMGDGLEKLSGGKLEKILETLSKSGLYGLILRAKGIIQSTDGSWMEFDFVPEEYEIREGNPDYTGRLCVIGSLLDEDGLKELFGV